MDKETKREWKKKRKQIYIFLLIAFPLLLILIFALYKLIPSLAENNFLAIVFVVVIGGFLYFAYDAILRKIESNKLKKPKKKDPYAD